MKWIELSIICKRVATDEVTTLFIDYIDNGIIEEDVDGHDDLVKLVIYHEPTIGLDEFKAQINEELQNAHIEVEKIDATIIDESTWYNSWQQYVEPTEILSHIIIKPAWQNYDAKEGDQIIEIDSDLSFGTGAHEITRCCARLLAKYADLQELSSLQCLDIDTGTGILLLVAAKLGVTRLTGIDIDPNAAEQVRFNCAKNNVEATII